MTAELFSLVILLCTYGNTSGCNNATNATYLSSKGPEYVRYIENNYKTFSSTVGVLAVAYEERLSANIGYNFTTSLVWKRGDPSYQFVRWHYDF